MKIFGFSTNGEENEYGIACGVVIADNKQEAVKIIASKNFEVDFTDDDIINVALYYNIEEIPLEQGIYMLGSYFE